MIYIPRFTLNQRLWRCSIRWIGNVGKLKVIRDRFPEGDVIRIWCCGFMLKAMVSR